MTTRLKRKLDDLEDAGVNLNESFCQIGTPLPSLADTKKDKNDFVPLWKQEVRDEQGRQRFHGAFTGGFSAGYYNTVGSKEGFTPASFISSRTNRATAQPSSSSTSGSASVSRYKQQTAEDFMDEEDLEDLRSARRLENTETFKDAREEGGNRGAEGLLGIGGSSLSSTLASLIQPATSSIGSKMLTKLGWRPGQGIGPRVSSRKLRLREAKLTSRGRTRGAMGAGVDPCDNVGETDGIDLAGEEAKKHTFAPRDTRLLVFDPKAGKEGLGFVRGQGMGETKSSSIGSRGLGLGAEVDMDDSLDVGGGFGLGPDGEDEDDVDIYEIGRGSLGHSGSRRAEVERSGRLMAFDELDENDGEGIILLGGSSSGSKDGRSKAGASSVDGQIKRRVKPNLPSTKTKSNTWNDGRLLIPGFELDPSAITQDKWFALPTVPDGWVPKPSRVWHKGSRWDKRERVDEHPSAALNGMVMGAARRVQLTSDKRGEALGERASPIEVSGAPPGPGASVFEYMSTKEKQRLADFLRFKNAGSVAATPKSGDRSIFSEVNPEDLVIPPLSPRTASAALKGFIPFGDDKDKQDRYCSYLQSQTLNTKQPIPKLFPSDRPEIVNKELSDFSKSAAMFKPMSFAMSNRFTSSTVSAQDLVQPKPGLHMPDPDKLEEWNDQSKRAEEVKEVLTPRQEAARAGLYGTLTRVVEDWAPNKLLCKRFGVQDPYPDGLPGSTGAGAGSSNASTGTRPLLAESSDVSWQDKFIHKPAIGEIDTAARPPANGAEPVSRAPTTLAEVGLADDENQGKDILTYAKPAIDIFKAIFASDSEDEDEDEPDSDQGDDAPLVAGLPSSASVEKGRTGQEATGRSPAITITRDGSSVPPVDQGRSALATDDTTKIDYESYRPTFTARRDADVHQESGNSVPGSRHRSKKDKKREKTKSKVLMSFDVGGMDGESEGEDGSRGGVVDSAGKKEREKKRKRRDIGLVVDSRDERKRRKADEPVIATAGVADEDQDQDEWVEKEVIIPGRKGRATAADLME